MAPVIPPNEAATALMVQGTTSDAGKTVLVAGLCRLLARRGVRVAPFKPQNMALNSAVTSDGGEIGRAQALQAQAAGIVSHTDMNPVLLKPNTDTAAQIIIHGVARHEMDARDYHQYKTTAMAAVMESWRRLQDQYEVLLVEGAGSPAEINLRDRDIANMGFAEAADVPVVIVADIDRGGVFAHLVGTLELLSPSEQARVRGFVINRFRGDISLLQPGLDWLEERTGKPVLGVLPYLHNLQLDAEDAIAVEQSLLDSGERLKVVVPVYPRISNHTDFDALRLHPQVDLQLIGPHQKIPPADLIILPGSKSVRTDLDWLREQGWEQSIQRHLRFGGKVLGICGGLQMLGETVADPMGVEGKPGVSTGLGLLPLATELHAEKHLHNVQGVLSSAFPDGSAGKEMVAVAGYEIHCGETRATDAVRTLVTLEDGRSDGYFSVDGQVAATYLHGILDSPQACVAVLRWAGLENAQPIDRDLLREQELERLADCLEAHLDIGTLFAHSAALHEKTNSA